MRWALIVTLLLLPGCFTELLVASDVTARNLGCAVVGGEPLSVIHYGDAPVDQTAITTAWVEAMPIDRAVLYFEALPQDAPPVPDAQTWTEWLDLQPVLDEGVTLHVLWVDEVAPIGQNLDVVRGGFLAINVTALREAAALGHDIDAVAQGILFHGMGHMLGVVNQGIPIQDANLTGRETSTGHEHGGAMDAFWHRVHDLPANATANRYSDEVLRDWSAAVADPQVCP